MFMQFNATFSPVDVKLHDSTIFCQHSVERSGHAAALIMPPPTDSRVVGVVLLLSFLFFNT